MHSFGDKKRCCWEPRPLSTPHCWLRFAPSPSLPHPSFLFPSFLLSLLHFLIKQQRDSFLAVSQEVKSLSNLNYFQLNNFLGLGERPSPPWVKCLPCWLSCSEAGLGANEAFDQILLIFSLSPVSAFVWSEPFFFFFFPLGDKHEWLQLTAIFSIGCSFKGLWVLNSRLLIFCFYSQTRP